MHMYMYKIKQELEKKGEKWERKEWLGNWVFLFLQIKSEVRVIILRSRRLVFGWSLLRAEKRCSTWVQRNLVEVAGSRICLQQNYPVSEVYRFADLLWSVWTQPVTPRRIKYPSRAFGDWHTNPDGVKEFDVHLRFTALQMTLGSYTSVSYCVYFCVFFIHYIITLFSPKYIQMFLYAFNREWTEIHLREFYNVQITKVTMTQRRTQAKTLYFLSEIPTNLKIEPWNHWKSVYTTIIHSLGRLMWVSF